jgi:hypothetical protein
MINQKNPHKSVKICVIRVLWRILFNEGLLDYKRESAVKPYIISA